MLAVGSLILDAVKTQSPESSLRAVLQESAVSAHVIDSICLFFAQQKDPLTAHFRRIGLSSLFPQIVGVDWRLDHCVKSKSSGKESVPIFFISVKTMYGETDEIVPISFTVSLEELQDLLAKVRIEQYCIYRSLSKMTAGGLCV